MDSVVMPALETASLPDSLSHLVAAAADERPHECAIAGEGDEPGVTFAQLKDAAVRIAESLVWDLRQQDEHQLQRACIGVLLSDSPLFMVAPCACSFAAQPFCYLGPSPHL